MHGGSFVFDDELCVLRYSHPVSYILHLSPTRLYAFCIALLFFCLSLTNLSTEQIFDLNRVYYIYSLIVFRNVYF